MYGKGAYERGAQPPTHPWLASHLTALVDLGFDGFLVSAGAGAGAGAVGSAACHLCVCYPYCSALLTWGGAGVAVVPGRRYSVQRDRTDPLLAAQGSGAASDH